MNIDARVQSVPESAWFKSSYSTGSGGECLEVATSLPITVHIRDSKYRNSPELALPREAWHAFVAYIR